MSHVSIGLDEASCTGRTVHPFRVGGSVSKSLAGTAVDEIIKVRGWKTERTAKYYIGSATSTRAPASKRTRDHACAHANEVALSQAFESDFLRVHAEVHLNMRTI